MSDPTEQMVTMPASELNALLNKQYYEGSIECARELLRTAIDQRPVFEDKAVVAQEILDDYNAKHPTKTATSVVLASAVANYEARAVASLEVIDWAEDLIQKFLEVSTAPLVVAS